MTAMLTIISLFMINAEIPAKITYMVGTVHIERGSTLYSGVLNAHLYVNDIITTKDESECEIQFSNYSLVHLEPNSSIKIEQKEETQQGIFQRIYASVGEIVSKVTKLNQGDEYEIRTDAAQAFIRGTTFKTNVAADGSSSFSVFEGQVAVKSIFEGAKEFLVDEKFSSQIKTGQLAPIIDQLSDLDISEFQDRFKDFIERGQMLDQLREKVEQEKEKLIEEKEKKEEEMEEKKEELEEKKEELMDDTKKKLEGLFK